MHDRPILIATRGSALALAQANTVLALCRAAFPNERFDLQIIKTTGDKMLTASLASSELPKGLFTKELEAALLCGEADLAVHSLKDLPTDLPPGLQLGAVSPRADVRDVLLCRVGTRTARSLVALPQGATVGTSSTRRSAQVIEKRPDLKVVPLRGNVGTRLKKLAEQPELDAIILAAAGLARLGFHIAEDGRIEGNDVPPGLIATPISLDEMLSAVGQAALGIEIRTNDARLERVCGKLNDPETRACVTAERAFLSAMGGGCHLAVAAYGLIESERVWLRAVSFLDGQPRRAEGRETIARAADLGRELAARLGRTT